MFLPVLSLQITVCEQNMEMWLNNLLAFNKFELAIYRKISISLTF